MNLLMIFFSLILIFIMIIMMFFFSVSKNLLFDSLFNSSFECGFSSYFFSRFSFSMHYFNVGMIFLFLDLELCMIFPFMNEGYSNFVTLWLLIVFIMALLLGLLQEWTKGLLEWKF